MGDGFTVFDLGLLLVTLFVGYRVWTVLGSRNGHEKDRTSPLSLVELDADTQDTATEGVPIVPVVESIQKADKSFNPDEFIEGAQKAFEMILRAFLAGDLKKLETFVSPKMFKEFKALCDNRTKEGHEADLAYFRLVNAEIEESDLIKKMAYITVKFRSEQTLLIKKGDKIIDGDPNVMDEVTDLWTFSRDIRSKTPLWTLEKITS